MKTVKIKYVDFWKGFDYRTDPVYTVITKYYNVEISEEPEYVIYSVFGREHLKYNCIRIFYTGEEQSPDFNICDYGIGFDYMDFGDRYFRLPLMYHPMFRHDYELMLHRHENSGKRDKFCSFVYSNNMSAPERTVFFNKLSEYKKVDSGGRYLNNVGGPVADKQDFEKNYRFSIAFENVQHPGYVTEKLMQAFAAGGIPIYLGDPYVDRMFNSKAFINVSDFPDFDAAVEYIKKVDSDDKLYASIMNEKALGDEASLEKIWQKFEKFVLNIFEQKPAETRRITGMCRNNIYQSLMIEQQQIYDRMKPLRWVKYKLNNIFKR